MPEKSMQVFRIDLLQLPKAELASRIQRLEGELGEKDTKIAVLKKELAGCKAELDKHLQEKIRSATNQPSSKQPEFNKDTGSEKKKRKRAAGTMDVKELAIKQSLALRWSMKII